MNKFIKGKFIDTYPVTTELKRWQMNLLGTEDFDLVKKLIVQLWPRNQHQLQIKLPPLLDLSAS